MRKVITFTIAIVTPFISTAQQRFQFPDGSQISREFIDYAAIILIVYLFIKLIMTLIRSRLDYRLKSRMIEKGVSEKIVEQFLQPQRHDAKNQSMKWFLLLTGGGIGLIILKFFLPMGIHSIAIMSLSIAISFLGYYYFLRQSEK